MSYCASTKPRYAPSESSAPQPQKKSILERLQRLTPNERIALRELMPVARAGELHGCTCAANGEPLPCEHCLDTIDEEEANVLAEMRKAEARGLHGWDNLAAVTDTIAREQHRFPEHKPSLFPLYRTQAEPGGAEKFEILEERIRTGCAVYRAGDKLAEFGTAIMRGGINDHDTDDGGQAA